MFNLFKRKKQLPAFETLSQSPLRDKYFLRTAQWAWLDSHSIYVVESNPARFITFDSWPQTVFIAADGQTSIEEFVYFMAMKYSGDIPATLDAIILEQIERLLQENLIALSDVQQRPAPGHDLARTKPS